MNDHSLPPAISFVLYTVNRALFSKLYQTLCRILLLLHFFLVFSAGDKYNPPIPFTNLLHINLANNLIFEEEGLLALIGWPSLKELVIWGNPLTTVFKGDPPVLSFQLGRLKGVRIFR